MKQIGCYWCARRLKLGKKSLKCERICKDNGINKDNGTFIWYIKGISSKGLSSFEELEKNRHRIGDCCGNFLDAKYLKERVVFT